MRNVARDGEDAMAAMRRRIVFGALTALLVSSVSGRGWAQEPAAPVPAATAPEAQTPADARTSQAAPVAPPKPVPGKKGKVAYTGPTDVIELPPTPMLDDEGKQRLDPDGKPMFNPPMKQERDKYGHPLFDEQGNPVFQTATDLGYDEKGHKLHAKKEKPPKTVAVTITRGTLTVDGMIGKAALNYDIKDFRYVYLYAPWREAERGVEGVCEGAAGAGEPAADAAAAALSSGPDACGFRRSVAGR